MRAALTRVGHSEIDSTTLVCCKCCKLDRAASCAQCVGCIVDLLPDCLVVHGVQSSQIDKCIFVSATAERMTDEFIAGEAEQWLAVGAHRRQLGSGKAAATESLADHAASLRKTPKTNWMPSRRTQLLMNSILSPREKGGAGLQPSGDDSNPVAVVFSLHDVNFAHSMMEAVMERPRFLSCTKMFSYFSRCGRRVCRRRRRHKNKIRPAPGGAGKAGEGGALNGGTNDGEGDEEEEEEEEGDTARSSRAGSCETEVFETMAYKQGLSERGDGAVDMLEAMEGGDLLVNVIGGVQGLAGTIGHGIEAGIAAVTVPSPQQKATLASDHNRGGAIESKAGAAASGAAGGRAGGTVAWDNVATPPAKARRRSGEMPGSPPAGSRVMSASERYYRSQGLIFLSCRRFYEVFRKAVLGGVTIHKMRYETKAHLQTNGWKGISPDEYFVHELRTNYGEEVAWFFAFNRHFLRHLIFPAVIGILGVFIEGIYRSNPAWCDAEEEDGERFNSYTRACSVTDGGWFLSPGPAGACDFCMQVRVIYIFIVVIGWAPYFIATWTAKEHVYRYRWGIEDNFVEADEPNPDYKWEREIKDPITDEIVRVYPAWKRSCVRVFRMIVLVGFYLAWLYVGVLFTLFFVLLRINFDAPAWDVILIGKDAVHGISIAALGTLVFKGVTSLIINLENHPMRGTKNARSENTFFALDWWNTHVILLLLALVFQPLRQSGLLAYLLCTPYTGLNEAYVRQPAAGGENREDSEDSEERDGWFQPLILNVYG